MTLNEFKIWFEGFMEGANAVGDKTQIIKSKLDKVSKGASPYEIPLKPYFVPSYRPDYPPVTKDQPNIWTEPKSD